MGEYLRLLRGRWPLIAAVCLVTVSIALVHYFITPKLYRASMVLRIEQRSLYPVQSQRNPWLDAWASIKYYPTQYWLLESRGLAERVVKELGLANDPKFAGTQLATSGEGGSNAGDDERFMAGLAQRLLGNLVVTPIRNTELVTLSYVSRDPQFAAKVVNAFGKAYIDWEIETRSASVDRASSFLDSQIESLQREIAIEEQRLQEATRSTDLVQLDPDTPGSNLAQQRLATLNAAYTQAISERLSKEAAYNELRSTPREVVADRESGGLIGEQRKELIRLESEYETKLQTYKPEWPEMMELRSKIDEGNERLQQLIAEQTDKALKAAYAEYQTALRSEASYLREIQKIKSDALDQSAAAVGLSTVQMEIDIRRELLDELLRLYSETGVTADLSGRGETNIRIVDHALVPTSPFRPSLSNDLSLGLSSGLVLGIGLVLLIHFLDRTVKTSEELERLLGFPVLTAIPDVTASRAYGYGSYGYGYGARGRKKREVVSEEVRIELLPQTRPRLAVSEAYRALRTALLLSSAEELKVVTLTSAESGEGKTVTAVNLGVVMAQLGRRVLLVDGDLRKPRLHKILETSNRLGLVNYLTGSVQPEEALLATSIPNLWFSPSGPQPPNPSELLASDRWAEFLEYGRAHFDFVIVDSPPILAVTDAIVSGSLGDGVVLCFRAHKILREEVRSCRDRLQLADVRILGAVLNRYRPTRGGQYSQRYNYYEAYAEAVEKSAADTAA